MEDHHGLGLEIIQEMNVAILTISHFVFYDNRDFFYRYIDDAFNRMDQENIVNLILDVRGNTGGDPFCAAHLFSYLEKEPVPYFSQPYGEYFRLSQTIPGRVIDTDTKTALVGATIIVLDTDPVIGTVTDPDGEFH
jgi:C-terminal processing protease CtpA/Prc